jgi:hypothetical protein
MMSQIKVKGNKLPVPPLAWAVPIGWSLNLANISKPKYIKYIKSVGL